MNARILLLAIFLLSFSFSFPQQWESLGSGLIDINWINRDTSNGVGLRMLADSANQNLYVAGLFNRAGGIPVESIARWDGAQWHRMGFAFEGVATSTLIFFNNELYAGSYIDPEHGIGPLGIWNGTEWIPAPYDSIFPYPSSFSDLAVFQNELYACGLIHYASDAYRGMIAKHDGAGYREVQNGLYGVGADALLVYNNELYVSGYFWLADSIPVSNIAKWDGTQWSSVGNGLSDRTYSMGEYNGDLYAGGYYGNIYKWTGAQWELFASTDNGISTLKEYNGKLYAAGYFKTINNDSINNIAEWDGVRWNSIASGTTGEYVIWEDGDTAFMAHGIDALEVFQGNLHAAGRFIAIDSVPASGIARWRVVSGINGVAATNRIRISPNPATEYILFENLSQEKDLELKVFSITGLLLAVRQLHNDKEWLNVRRFPEGLFVYSISSNNKVVERGKFIKLNE